MNDSIHNIMNEWLDRFGVEEKADEQDLPAGQSQARSRAGLKKMPFQRELDLHGLIVSEALDALDHFLNKCRKDNIRKVLIIHGKGIHSNKGPVLKEEVVNYLKNNSFIGEIGTPGRAEGGSGASWAIIRQRSR